MNDPMGGVMSTRAKPALSSAADETAAQTAAMIGRTIFFMFILSFTIFQTDGS